MVVGYVQVTFWSLAAYRQGQRIRTLLFRSLLKQEIGWFDVHESGELNNRLSEYVTVPHIYRPQMMLREGNTCLSVHRGWCVSQHAMWQADWGWCIPACNGAGRGWWCVSQHAIGQGRCEAGVTHPTGLHPCWLSNWWLGKEPLHCLNCRLALSEIPHRSSLLFFLACHLVLLDPSSSLAQFNSKIFQQPSLRQSHKNFASFCIIIKRIFLIASSVAL